MKVEGFAPDIFEQWNRFVQKHSKNPAGADLYPEIFDEGLFPLQRKNELVAMMQLARSVSPRTVMEIGSDKGGGFFHWVKCLSTVRRAIALEFRGVPFAETFVGLFPEVNFCFGDGSSYAAPNINAVKKFLEETPGGRQWQENKIDCLFIDGDKNGTLQDFEAYLPMMSTGGLVFIHDIVDDINPKKVFYDLARRFRITAIIDGREGSEAMQRKTQGLPCDSSYEDWLRIWKWTSCGVGVVHV